MRLLNGQQQITRKTSAFLSDRIDPTGRYCQDADYSNNPDTNDIELPTANQEPKDADKTNSNSRSKHAPDFITIAEA